MFCTKCGTQLRDTDKFCAECATPTAKLPLIRRANDERLSRPRADRKVAGVCAGIARYLDADVTVIRLIAAILLFWPVPSVGGLAYLVLMMVMPEDPIALPAATLNTTQT